MKDILLLFIIIFIITSGFSKNDITIQQRNIKAKKIVDELITTGQIQFQKKSNKKPLFLKKFLIKKF